MGDPSNKNSYLVVEVTGSSLVTLQDVKTAHGDDVQSLFKTDKIRAIHLGRIVEIWDHIHSGNDIKMGPSISKCLSPEKHAWRDAMNGPLPLDMHTAQLQRRDLTKLGKQSLSEAFAAIVNGIKKANMICQEAVNNGHRPLLLEDMEFNVGTKFTGLGSIEEALAIMEPHVALRFQSLYACDANADARKIFEHRFAKGKKNLHCFKDVLELATLPKTMWNQSFHEKTQAANQMDMTSEVKCLRHRRKCSLPDVHMDASGSVCKDYSAQGKKAGTEGYHVVSMVTHFQDLKRRRIPLRLSENVVNAEGQSAIKSAMDDCDVRYLITMPEDVGFGSVRRDRGWLAGVCPPYRFYKDPNEMYQQLTALLSQKQVPQSELWFETKAGLNEERRQMASSFRCFKIDGSLFLGCLRHCLDSFGCLLLCCLTFKYIYIYTYRRKMKEIFSQWFQEITFIRVPQKDALWCAPRGTYPSYRYISS